MKKLLLFTCFLILIFTSLLVIVSEQTYAQTCSRDGFAPCFGDQDCNENIDSNCVGYTCNSGVCNLPPTIGPAPRTCLVNSVTRDSGTNKTVTVALGTTGFDTSEKFNILLDNKRIRDSDNITRAVWEFNVPPSGVVDLPKLAYDIYSPGDAYLNVDPWQYSSLGITDFAPGTHTLTLIRYGNFGSNITYCTVQFTAPPYSGAGTPTSPTGTEPAFSQCIQNFSSCFTVPGIPSGGAAKLSQIIVIIIYILMLIGVVLAVAFLLYGCILWITSGGDKQKLEGARKTVTYSIIGLIIIISALVIVTILGAILKAPFIAPPRIP